MSAFLIPENIPTRDDLPSGLRGMAQALRDLLPEDVTVWLEDRDEQAPFLLILDPSCGVLALDVMDETGLKAALERWPENRRGEASALAAERVRAQAEDIRNRARAERLLKEPLAIGVAIAAPLLDRERLARRYQIPPNAPTILTKEDLRAGGLAAALRRAIAGSDEPRPVKEETIVRAVLHPEIVISRSDEQDGRQLVFRPPRTDGEDVIRVLDREQERVARRLDGGYRVIRGVAGSGKTLVLTYRARFLAESFPSWKILLTCFNICLARALEQELKLRSATRLPGNVEVRHIDAVARSVLARAGYRIPHASTPEEWTAIRKMAVEALARRPDLRQYDAVLVDEAQDFDSLGLDLAWALLREGRDHFVIALDGAQNIYRKRARWNPPGLTARGRTTVLRVNYRNTKEILEYAWRFLTAGTHINEPDELLDDPDALVPPEATRRRGPCPEILTCRDRSAEIREIVDRLRRAHAEGVPWGEMAIILGSSRLQGSLYFETQRRGVPYFFASRSGKSKREFVNHGDKVRAFTIHGAKGLEFSRVFLCGVNDIYDPGASLDPTGRRRLAYVAMTRAMDHLTITVSGKGDIGAAILEAAGSSPTAAFRDG